ncbi:hypothetical protein ACVIW2_000811 [Bradyrhizobium huanghuaihaiense]
MQIASCVNISPVLAHTRSEHAAARCPFRAAIRSALSIHIV